MLYKLSLLHGIQYRECNFAWPKIKDMINFVILIFNGLTLLFSYSMVKDRETKGDSTRQVGEGFSRSLPRILGFL